MKTKQIDATPKEKNKKKKVDDDVKPKKKKKRVVDDDEDEKPKKKKKLSESRELAIAEPPKLSKLKGKALRTQFGQGAEKILALLERDDTDPAVALIYKRLLQSVVDMLPLAELAVRASKGTRGIHGLNMMISSLRELMVDVQTAQDRGQMGVALVGQVIQPGFNDIASAMVLEYSLMMADIKGALNDEDWKAVKAIVLDSRAKLADKITEHYKTMREGTVQFLQR